MTAFDRLSEQVSNIVDALDDGVGFLGGVLVGAWLTYLGTVLL